MKIDSMFYPSDLLPAAPVAHGYKNVWLRDLYYTGLCSDKLTRKRIWNAVIKIMDDYKWKLQIHASKPPVHWYEHIHVRYSPQGKEITNEHWRHNQFDAHANAGEICLDEERLDLVDLWVDNLATEECFRKACAGMWEDKGTPDTYSIAACLNFFERAEDALPHRKQFIQDQIGTGYEKLKSLLPYADRYETVCLSLLGVIWPYNKAGEHTQEIIKLVCNNLKRRPFGFIRYRGDSYDGEHFTRGTGNEVPWLLGDLFMEKIQPENSEWRNRTEKAKDIFGMMPEAYFPENLQPNRNSPLVWAEAMYNSVF